MQHFEHLIEFALEVTAFWIQAQVMPCFHKLSNPIGSSFSVHRRPF